MGKKHAEKALALVSFVLITIVAAGVPSFGSQWTTDPAQGGIRSAGDDVKDLKIEEIKWGDVGYRGCKHEIEGVSRGTYGTNCPGAIMHEESVNEDVEQSNSLTQKWVEDDGVRFFSIKARPDVLQEPVGVGASFVSNGGSINSTWTTKLNNVVCTPSNGTIEGSKLSLQYTLINISTYTVTETVTHWSRTITIGTSQESVEVTAVVNAQAVLIGGAFANAVQQILQMKVTLTLPKPAP